MSMGVSGATATEQAALGGVAGVAAAPAGARGGAAAQRSLGRIGYMAPEFPGQTHIFFWREIQALAARGVEVDLVSTRRPANSIVCHSWSAEAAARTTYLFPPRVGALGAAAGELLRAGPARWWECARAIRSVRDAGARERARLLGLVVMGAAMAARARRAGWRHVHVHSCADSAYVAMFARILSGLPYSLTLHGPLSYYRSGQSEKWRRAEFAVAVTERLRDEVAALLPEFDGERLSVAAMGVDLGVFQRRAPYRAYDGRGVFRVATCARLHPQKGHDDVIRAVAELRARGVEAELDLLGEGPARPALEALVKELGIEGAVRMPGARAEEGVRDALEAAHVFALGSHEEAIGVATMEAMAMSLPVVVTDVGGVRELVRDGVDGALVPAQAPERMAAALLAVARDPAGAARMGAAGQARVTERFGSDVSARAIAERLAATAPWACSAGKGERA